MRARKLARSAAIATAVVVATVALRDRGASPAPIHLAEAPKPSIAVSAAPPPPPPPPAAPPNHLIGSAKCGDCHDKELAAWKRSWHARALAPANRRSLVG